MKNIVIKKRKRRIRFNIINLITCLCFFGILITLPVITGFMKKEAFSHTENRMLAALPELSVKSIFDRKFMNGIESYVSDNFIGRVSWIKAKNNFDLMLGKYEQNGVYILDNRLVEIIAEPDYSSVEKSIEAVNSFSDENETPVFLMLVPTSAEIYSDEIPENAPKFSQKDFIEYVYENMNGSIATIDAYSSLYTARDKYIYYRTDHHWTSLGAYNAYVSSGNRMGYTPIDEKAYDIEHAAFDFKGTFHSKTLYDKTEADVIDIYRLNDDLYTEEFNVYKDLSKEPEKYDSIYFREFLSVKDKYSVFLGSNQPMVTIKNNNGGGKLLIFKDSFAHSYVPFLTEHYSEITLLDLRYIQTAYNKAVNISNYDQVLILYSAPSFAEDINLRKLGYTE